MKASLLVKLLLVFPVILFADYIIMALLGCAGCLLGFGNGFFCGPYCLVGKAILLLSAVFFGYLIYPDFKHLFGRHRNA
jgi:hypothetical protein